MAADPRPSAPAVFERNKTLEHPKREDGPEVLLFITAARASPELDTSQGSRGIHLIPAHCSMLLKDLATLHTTTHIKLKVAVCVGTGFWEEGGDKH